MEETTLDKTTATQRLAELIRAKLRILEQVRELSRRQPDVIATGDMAQLMSVLAGKDRLLADLQRVEQALNPFRDDDPDARVWQSAEARSQCRDDAKRCETLLGEIMLVEQRCEKDLIDRRANAAQRLAAANEAMSVRAAYAGNAPAQSKLDLSSES